MKWALMLHDIAAKKWKTLPWDGKWSRPFGFPMENVSVDFMQGNQLLIKKADGTVTAGLSGSASGKKVRIWTGDETPDDTPFRVDEDGNLVAKKADISGTVNATGESIGSFIIINNWLTQKKDPRADPPLSI